MSFNSFSISATKIGFDAIVIAYSSVSLRDPTAFLYSSCLSCTISSVVYCEYF
jgi:hypothetical protein